MLSCARSRIREIDGKAFSLNFYHAIRDRFHIWFYCESALRVLRRLTGKQFSPLCNVMSFGSGELYRSVVYSNNCDNMAHWMSMGFKCWAFLIRRITLKTKLANRIVIFVLFASRRTKRSVGNEKVFAVLISVKNVLKTESFFFWCGGAGIAFNQPQSTQNIFRNLI